ncbi:MAG: adenosylcobinamide-GDP ribazoletransferase [Betaproteobacteria bacterium]|nr:MAG: adenosylcobinamide-GDP ribazoletransferase [Betaproteobacteria bacterium]
MTTEPARSVDAMREQIRLALVAWQFLTRVPLGAALEAWIMWTPERLRASARYFSLVGMIVGAFGALVFFLATLAFGQTLGAILSITATAVMTGAFHEDGFVDYFDSFGAAGDRAKALAIMKDSRIGTFGAIALVLLCAIKVAALIELPIWLAVAAIIASHSLGRVAACVVMYRLDYVRDTDLSKAKPLAEKMTRTELLLAVALGLAPLAFIAALGLITLLWTAVALLASVLLVAMFIRHLRARLGGFTGDTLGAVEQLTELTILLVFVAASR